MSETPRALAIRNPRTAAASPLWMSMGMKRTEGAPRSRTRPRSEDAGLWLVLALGVVLMLLAAAARGDETESRVERFNAHLGPGSTLRIGNISGDVVAVPGREFRAVVEISATAPTRERAREVLERVQVLQSRSGDAYTLETRWPRSLFGWQRFDGRRLYRCAECKVSARYEVTLPPGVTARLETVNGEVRTRDIAGDLRLRTVNGRVEALGVRRSLDAQTVNGALEAVAAVAAPGTSYQLHTVNGSVLLTLPKEARFQLSASTMNGALASTFALPRSSEEWDVTELTARPRAARSPRQARRIVVTDGGEEGVTVVDVKELEKELEKSLKEIEAQIQESAREVRQIRIVDPRRGYKGVVGGGGANVELRSMNGAITLLASGTRESEAKPLMPQRRSFVVTVPEIEVKLPRIRIEPRSVIRIEPDPRPVSLREHDEEIVRGDVSGNFLSTRGGSSYSIGNVSGAVKILSHSGEIRVASAGAGADLKTLGGDIKIQAVRGDLRAHTGAGDIRAGSVTGSLYAETSGGDIRAEQVRGGVDARTAGGDIVLASVAGPVQAETAGGLVRVGIVSSDIKGGIAIRNQGGDVSLTLPSDLRANIELIVAGALLADERMVRSDFPELAVTRRQDGVYASGMLNGGGPKVVVRTTSGVIRLRKGAPAAN